jgi:hypothetical protein
VLRPERRSGDATDLLGLVVHLDQVVLDITAEQGPGNLLCKSPACSTTAARSRASPGS